jgi:hypothetical protein
VAARYQTNPEVRLAPSARCGLVLAVPGTGQEGRCTYEASALVVELLHYFAKGRTLEAAARRFAKQRVISTRQVRAAIRELVDARALLVITEPGRGPALLPRQRAILLEGAKSGVLPANVPCRVGCRFCYERWVKKMHPGGVVDALPRHTDAAFDFFLRECRQRYGGPITLSSVWMPNDGQSHIGVHADVFGMGLTPRQMECILSHNERLMASEEWREFSDFWYTAGYRADPELARRFQRDYPRAFRLYVSAVTFDDDLRKRLVPGLADSEPIRRLLRAVRSPVVAVLHVNQQQTLRDLTTIDQMGLIDPLVIIGELHGNAWHPSEIQALARHARRGIARVAARVLANDVRFGSLTAQSIWFHGPAIALARKYQDFIRALLEPYDVGRDDVVLCSVAASPVVREVVAGRCRVAAVPDSLGGTTTFACTVTTADIVRRLRELHRRGVGFRRVLLPDSFWFNEGQDLSGTGPAALRRAFPNVTMVIVRVPFHMLADSLTCAECVAFSGRPRPGLAASSAAVPAPRPVEAPLTLRTRIRSTTFGWEVRARVAMEGLLLGRGDAVVCPADHLHSIRDIAGPDVSVLPFGCSDDAGTRRRCGVAGDKAEDLVATIRHLAELPRRLILVDSRGFDGRSTWSGEGVSAIREGLAGTKVVVVTVPAT